MHVFDSNVYGSREAKILSVYWRVAICWFAVYTRNPFLWQVDGQFSSFLITAGTQIERNNSEAIRDDVKSQRVVVWRFDIELPRLLSQLRNLNRWHPINLKIPEFQTAGSLEFLWIKFFSSEVNRQWLIFNVSFVRVKDSMFWTIHSAVLNKQTDYILLQLIKIFLISPQSCIKISQHKYQYV